ncbi:MAG: aminodeoxychorismate synthase component I [Alphaproteobacteria bacterium]
MPTDNQALVLLDDRQFGRIRVFERPVGSICCREAAGAGAALARLEEALNSGLHAAGFMAYELGYALEPRLSPLMPDTLPVPLLWFGLFEAPEVLEGEALTAFLHGRTKAGHRLSGTRTLWDRQAYAARFGRVQNYIEAGDVYQVNLTFPLDFVLEGDPLSLWAALRARQPVAHGGFIRTERFSLLSLSPELFVERRRDMLTSRPMKGTAAREPGAGDREAAERLSTDEKSRAENLMIVDLIRNDLARVTRPGSVQVPELFRVEAYPRFFGMTSTVTGRLRGEVHFAEIVKALFPCGSVTGAPKIRAQEVIRELESAPRGAYTGSLGYIAPDGEFSFNVAIRTAHIDEGGAGVMGIGSGIVRDSQCEAEYDECLLKASFLTQEAEPFRLIETLLWTPDEGFRFLAEHLERLGASAAHFGFAHDEEEVRRALADCAAGLKPVRHIVRLLSDEHGEIRVSAAPLGPSVSEWTWTLSPERVQSCDPFLRHKTTRRALYDGEHARLRAETGCDEVIFLNERGELAEGSRTTIFLRRDGELFTPRLTCGALDGVLRRVLMRDPGVGVREKVLYPEDLERADEVLLGNSVRGLIPARPM